ncbi:hypothetical protein T01_14641 [Trichinella spiralis]|uniref:Uncharacterized protein n=1 Tax=Trichinella spiralis TaxID=6334 RepID=A0A0V1B773_TRISP|nr:hypothetical protein T01_14641 [Trichinella spiralis]
MSHEWIFQLSKLFQRLIIAELKENNYSTGPLIFTKKYYKLVFFLQITKIDLSAARLHNKIYNNLGISLDNQESYLYKFIRKFA